MPQPLTPQQMARNRARAQGLLPDFMPNYPSATSTLNTINKEFAGQGGQAPLPQKLLPTTQSIFAPLPPVWHPVFKPQPMAPPQNATPRSHPIPRPPISPRPQTLPMGPVQPRNPLPSVVNRAPVPSIVRNPNGVSGVGMPMPSPFRNQPQTKTPPVISPSDHPLTSPTRYVPVQNQAYSPVNQPPAAPPAYHPSFGRQMFDNTFGTGNHRGDIGQFFHGFVTLPSLAFQAAKNIAEGGVAGARGTYDEVTGNYADSQRQAQIAQNSWHHTRDTIGGMFGANPGGALYNATTALGQYAGGDTEGAKATLKGIGRDAALHPFNTAMTVLPIAGGALLGRAAALERAAEAANGARKAELLEQASQLRNLAQGGKPGQLVRNAVGRTKGAVMANPTGRRIVQTTNHVVQEATNTANAINNFKNPLPRRPTPPRPGMTLADSGKPTTVDINGRPVAAPLSKDSSWQAHMDAEIQKNTARAKRIGDDAGGDPSNSPKPDDLPHRDPDATYYEHNGLPTVLVNPILHKRLFGDNSPVFINRKGKTGIENQILNQFPRKPIPILDPADPKPIYKDMLDKPQIREDLHQSIGQALRDENAGVIFIPRGMSQSEYWKSRWHEAVHMAQSALGGGDFEKALPDRKKGDWKIDKHPAYQKAYDALTSMPGGDQYIGNGRHEIPAYIAGGEYKRLGLNEQEAWELIKAYTTDLVEKHGTNKAARVFSHSHELAKDAADATIQHFIDNPHQRSWIEKLLGQNQTPMPPPVAAPFPWEKYNENYQIQYPDIPPEAKF